MSSASSLARRLNEIKRGFAQLGTNQDALQALFGDDVTACFGKRVQLEPTPMRRRSGADGHPAKGRADRRAGG